MDVARMLEEMPLDSSLCATNIALPANRSSYWIPLPVLRRFIRRVGCGMSGCAKVA